VEAWAEDLLTSVKHCDNEVSLFKRVLSAAHALGFDRCAYGMRMALPITRPRVFMINNYPLEWRSRYEEAGYLRTDPTVLRGRRSQAPFIWGEPLFGQAPDFWSEAVSFGLRVGWVQSSLSSGGSSGMLTLSRSGQLLSASELCAKEAHMCWLAHMSHVGFSRILAPQLSPIPLTPLTGRELEVLKWLADGKTSRDAADILGVSIDTVNFHVKNATLKLGAANKTAAAVRAALLGLLN